jgi:hypothetical protein
MGCYSLAMYFYKINLEIRMDERINRIATLANVQAYNTEATEKYIDGAPHIKHDENSHSTGFGCW